MTNDAHQPEHDAAPPLLDVERTLGLRPPPVGVQRVEKGAQLHAHASSGRQTGLKSSNLRGQ